MRRLFGSLLVGLAAGSAALGHALYVVPAGDKVVVVFSDDLDPDPGITPAAWKKVAGLKLRARDAAGAETEVTWTQEKDHLSAAAPAGARVIYGQVDYGVSTKGAGKPRLVRFYPKAVVGPVPADGGRVGDGCGLEVVPRVDAGKVRFQVLARGKPVAGAKVAVMVPDKDKADVTADDAGTTPAFDAVGRYGVTVRQAEDAAGEAGGQKYEAISHTATLVVDVK